MNRRIIIQFNDPSYFGLRNHAASTETVCDYLDQVGFLIQGWTKNYAFFQHKQQHN